MMNDLRRFIVRAFERGERQADTSWRQKSYGVLRKLISSKTKRLEEDRQYYRQAPN
jgi:hypothetical protein